MQIKLITAAALMALLCACQPQDNSKTTAVSNNKAASAATSSNNQDMTAIQSQLQAAIQQTYPEQKVQIKSVQKTPINGLYEVVIVPNQLVYMDAKGEYMLLGNLMNMKTKTNLTEERLTDLNRIDYQKLPFDSAIKEVRGNGNNQVAVFSDPDCPFCKRLEHEIAQMTDVTIYTFLMPIESLHPGSTAKSEQIWCQPNRTDAWTKWMRNDVAPTAVANCKNPVADLMKLSESFGFNGTPTIIFPNGKVQSGYMEKAAFEQALQQNQK